MKGNKMVANLGRNGISALWATLLCVYFMIVGLVCFFANSWGVSWLKNLSILGTIPEALLWYWICRRLFSERKMKRDMYILIMIFYGMCLLMDVFLFFMETESLAFIFMLMRFTISFIFMIMMLGRYDGALKEYAKCSIICGAGYIVAYLIYGDPSEMIVEDDRIFMKMFIFLEFLPYEFLRHVLYEGDEDDGEEELPLTGQEDEANAENASMVRPSEPKAPKQKHKVVSIVAIVISAIVVITSLGYMISLWHGGLDTVNSTKLCNSSPHEKVIILKDGLVTRYVGENEASYIGGIQDSFIVDKRDAYVEIWYACDGKGVVFLKDYGSTVAYARPTLHSEVVATLYYEEGYVPDAYRCLGYNDGWFAIEINGNTGYVREEYVDWDAINTF